MGSFTIHSRKYGNCIVLFDDEDFELISKYTWHATVRRNKSLFHVQATTKGRTIYLHRLVMGFAHRLIDHKNGNGLDNRKDNLRAATQQQNLANRGKNINNKSGFKGVSNIRSGFKARIEVNSKEIHLGVFKTAELAAQAYNTAAIEYFGEFAHLNPLNNSVRCNPNTNPHFRVINSCDAIDSGNYGYCKGCQSTVH